MALTAGGGRIGNFVNNIIGKGFSYNNEYSFSFQKRDNSPGETINIAQYLRSKNFGSIISTNLGGIAGEEFSSILDKLVVLCEEISLPGVSSATGNARGLNQGVDFKYAHSKIYNDLSISFICTKDYEPMRLFQEWFHFIYDSNDSDAEQIKKSYTTQYYDDYCMNMKIFKDEEKSNAIEFNSSGRVIQKKSVVYTLINAFPTSISSVPLNTGASQIVRFTVNLAYERWTFRSYNSAKNFDGQNAVNYTK